MKPILRYSLILVSTFAISYVARAQSFLWGEPFGGSSSGRVTDVATSSDGLIYAAGYFSGTGEFDLAPGADELLVESENEKSYITCSDPQGLFQWALHFDSDGNNHRLQTLSTDQNNNLIGSGYYSGDFDVDPGEGVQMLPSNSGGFLFKLDPNGSFLWARTFAYGESANTNRVAEHQVDASGNIYVSFHFYEEVDLLEGDDEWMLENPGDFSVGVIKLSPSGDILWTNVIGGPERDTSSSIAVDPGGNVYVSGKFNGTAEFDPDGAGFQLTASQADASFIAKYDDEGIFLWAQELTNMLTEPDHDVDLCADNDGNVYFSASFEGTAEIAGETLTADAEDALLVKLNDTGSFLWSVVVSSNSDNQARQVKFNGEWLVFTGRVYGDAMINGDGFSVPLTSNGSWDVYTMRISTEGQLEWAVNWGNSGGDFPGGVAFHPNGQLIHSGVFFNSIDLDFGENEYEIQAVGSVSCYITAMDPTPVGITESSAAEFNLFPNPSNGQIQIQTPADLNYDEVHILNSAGQLMQQVPLANRRGALQLTLPEPAGIYIVQLIDKGSVLASQRVIRY